MGSTAHGLYDLEIVKFLGRNLTSVTVWAVVGCVRKISAPGVLHGLLLPVVLDPASVRRQKSMPLLLMIVSFASNALAISFGPTVSMEPESIWT